MPKNIVKFRSSLENAIKNKAQTRKHTLNFKIPFPNISISTKFITFFNFTTILFH